MITRKTNKLSDNPKEYGEILLEFGKENWMYSHEKFGRMFFYKKVTGKQDKERKLSMQTPEFTEFITYYRKQINNNGSYDDRLIDKYTKLLRDIKHDFIMENLRNYKKHLELNKTKNPLQVGSYLNQKRYMDTWNILSKEVSTKWQDDILKEYNLGSDIIENIKCEVKAREFKNKPKEITDGIFRNIIKYVLGEDSF